MHKKPGKKRSLNVIHSNFSLTVRLTILKQFTLLFTRKNDYFLRFHRFFIFDDSTSRLIYACYLESFESKIFLKNQFFLLFLYLKLVIGTSKSVSMCAYM